MVLAVAPEPVRVVHATIPGVCAVRRCAAKAARLTDQNAVWIAPYDRRHARWQNAAQAAACSDDSSATQTSFC